MDHMFSEPQEFPLSLAKCSLGEVHTARWMNLATRILRLYVTLLPTDPVYLNVRKLAVFIVGYYAKVISFLSFSCPTANECIALLTVMTCFLSFSQMFMRVVHQWHLEKGASHFLGAVKLAREVVGDETERKQLTKSLINNCYFGHPTNVLLAMLGMTVS